MRRTEFKQVAGKFILLAFFTGLFWAIAAEHGVLHTAFVFAVSVVMVKILVTAIDWMDA